MDLDALRKQKQQRKQAEVTLRSNKISNDSIRNKTYSPTDNNLDAEGHYQLGEWYYDGLNGYPLDRQQALAEYLKAAELGHTKAMLEVGYEYTNPSDTLLEYDLEKAQAWGRRALNQGEMDAYRLFYAVEEERDNGKSAMALLETGVTRGSRSCTEWLAYILYWGYEIGDFEIKPDEDRAFKLLSSVEWDDDYSIAYELLGNIYRDQEKPYLAKEYYDKALKADPKAYGAMASLGGMLRTIDEIKDYSKAKDLLSKAAESGNLTAMNSYGVMLYLGEGVDQHIPTALDWFMKAADRGYTQAMINLGDHFAEDNPKEAKYWYNQAKEYGDSRGEERLKEMGESVESTDSIDTSRSDKIYDNFLNNLDNTFNLSPSTVLNSGFPNRIKGIQKVIDKGDLSAYEADRLKILQGWLSLCYFNRHFLDKDFSKQEDDYYKILDAVDDYIRSMSEITDEGAYIYYIANMYSADRFKDVKAIDKLEDLWTKISEIELDETQTEFKVKFWQDMAKEVYDLMSEILDPDSSSADYYDSYEEIKNKVMAIIADKLSLDEEEVHLYSRLVQDLGADSLDAIELIMEMEKEFGLTIPDEDAERIRTVGDIVTYIRAHY